MAKRKNNKISKAKEANPERETRVLLEQVRHELKTVAEGHSMVISKLDEIDNKFRKNESDHFKFEMTLEGVKSQTGTINSKADRIEKELGTIKNAVMDVGNVMKDHEDRLKKQEVIN